MVVLKVNEYLYNEYGMAMTVLWSNNIKRHFENREYTTTERETVSNKSVVHTFDYETVKIISEYYNTGRIVVKTAFNGVLQEIVNRHEEILGMKLSEVSNNNINTTPTKSPKKILSTPTTLNKSMRIAKSKKRANKVELQGKEIILKNYEEDVLSLKREVNELRLIISDLAKQLTESIQTQNINVKNTNNNDEFTITKD